MANYKKYSRPRKFKDIKNIEKINPHLQIKGYPSRKRVFDWRIPDEWIIKDAYIQNKKNRKIINFKRK